MVLLSCETPEHNFSAEERKIIDSLFRIQKDSIDSIMELECDTIYYDFYHLKVDSIKALRQKEIRDILSK